MTREDFQKATGIEAPPYDPTRAPKGWFDPTAAASPRRTVVYDPIVATTASGQPLSDAAGKPMLDILLLSREEAATVNIWHDQSGQPVPMLQPVPTPMRPLRETEELFFLSPQVVSVRDTSVEPDNGMFSAKDRTLLQKIAAKLGVS